MAEIKRPRVPDPDPEDEVGDGERPADRLVHAPDADPRRDDVDGHQPADRAERPADHERDPPPQRRGPLDQPADQVGQRAEVVFPFDQGRRGRHRIVCCRSCAGLPRIGPAIFGLGFFTRAR